MIKDNILLVGCGKMGGALLGGLISKVSSLEQILVVTKTSETASKISKDYKVNAVTQLDTNSLDKFKVDTVIFAVKPQIIGPLLTQYSKICPKDTLFLSIAAGKTISFYEKHLGDDKAIVRAMPNLPAIVGQGVTVVCANGHVDEAYKKRTDDLFASVGKVAWLEDENLLDAVTAISGSGPAYVFYFIECLIDAAIELGLPEDLALMLANSTTLGSAQLAEDSNKTAKQLKEQVISPKGTTQAGMEVLEHKSALLELIRSTTKSAYKRSKQLAE